MVLQAPASSSTTCHGRPKDVYQGAAPAARDGRMVASAISRPCSVREIAGTSVEEKALLREALQHSGHGTGIPSNSGPGPWCDLVLLLGEPVDPPQVLSIWASSAFGAHVFSLPPAGQASNYKSFAACRNLCRGSRLSACYGFRLPGEMGKDHTNVAECAERRTPAALPPRKASF